MKLLFFLALSLFSQLIFSEFMIELDNRNRTTKLILGTSGYVQYIYDENRLLEITRHTKEGNLLYTHTYEYDAEENPVREGLIGDLGEITYKCINDPDQSTLVTMSPLHREECIYNSKGQLLTHIQDVQIQQFSYDEKNRLVHENIYTDISYELDDLGRIVSQINSQGVTNYQYNEKNQLINTTKPNLRVHYTYGDLGERLSKTMLKGNEEVTERYFSIGKEPIGIIRNDKLIYLQIPGLSLHRDLMRPIAIETEYSTYAPIHNTIGHISHLINIDMREKISYFHDPYGQNLAKEHLIIPWIFAGKYYDSETDLVCYGDRYYSPSLKVWLTPDKIEDPSREYPLQYCLDNPIFYCDPDGNFQVNVLRLTFGAARCALTCPLLAPGAAMIVAGAVVGYGAGKLIGHIQEKHRINEYHKILERKKAGGIDTTIPQNIFEDENWKDITHPEARLKEKYKFKNKNSSEILEFNKGKPGDPGHKGHSHYHRRNPNSKNKHDKYLDENHKPVRKGSEPSHLYHPSQVWWE